MPKDPQLDQKFLKQFFGGQPVFTPPSIYYMALYTTLPTDAASGTEVSAPLWTNYSRLAIPNDSETWTVPTTTNIPPPIGGATTVTYSRKRFSFGIAIIPTGTIPILGWALWDAPTGGVRWHWGSVSSTNQISNNRAVYFPVGQISITET